MPSGTANLDQATGELRDLVDRAAKWQLQATARSILGAGHRLRICHRHRRPDWVQVEVRQGEAWPYYAGLQACGLLWVCPVCAAKVQAVRALELRDGIEYWRDTGGDVELATLTVPHGRGDDLRDLVAQLVRAYQKMTRSRAYAEWVERWDLSGTVRGTETTWGPVHGWHPHLHVVQFRGGDGRAARERVAAVGAPERADELFGLWHHAVTRHTRLSAPSRRAFSLQDADHAARYVTKLGTEYSWTTADELVRSHSKRGRHESLSPFDLLRREVEGVEGPWRSLFRHYEAAFKGQRQLVWSKGLRVLLGRPDERSDQEVADSIGADDAILASISPDDWTRIRDGNHQATVLQVVAHAGAAGLGFFLESLREGAHDG